MTVATHTLEKTEQVEHLAALAQQVQNTGPDWLKPIREQALVRFLELGLPTKKDEEWRYTDPAPLTQTRFALPADRGSVSAEQVQRFAIPELKCSRLVLVDGRYIAELSQLEHLPKGAQVYAMSEALKDHEGMLEHHIAAAGEASNEAFTRLNAMLFEDGVFVYVPAGKAIEDPIHVLNITTDAAGAEGMPAMHNPRNVIITDEGASVSVIEHYVSTGDAVYFNNAVTQIEAGERAEIDHYVIEEESPNAYQLSTLISDQQKQSHVHSHTMLFGGRLVRNNINPRINGEQCDCLINGLYMGQDQQHMDNHMRVEHNAGHCDSRQFYKGVLNDKAHAVFSGRIYVKRGAQKTDAKQENANLLLSGDAEATTKPQLEIFADDVKCTHGATIGQIQEEAVFYLMARGVDKATARAMMIYSFAAECLERMKHEAVRRYLAVRILDRLPEGRTLEALIED